jgi:hypothetical protein
MVKDLILKVSHLSLEKIFLIYFEVVRYKLFITISIYLYELNSLFFLTGLLFEIKGSSVGVLVSGPKQMRQEVASICSSGLVENLHFESISFTW